MSFLVLITGRNLQKTRRFDIAEMNLVTKKQLAQLLGRRSTRIIDSWMRKRMVPFFKLGHRTILFDVEKVRAALVRFEVKEVGRK